MTDQEKLDAAAYNQSYHFDDLVPNEYNGKDNLEIGKIQDDHIYALVHDGQLNKLDQGEIAPEYFFDQSTFDKYVDPKTGEFDVLLHDIMGKNTEWFSAVPCSCVMDLPDRDAPYQQSRPQSCPQDQDERRKWSSCDRKPEGDIQKKIRR